MYFDQLLLAARKVHVVYFDQLLGAAHYIHFIFNHDNLSVFLVTTKIIPTSFVLKMQKEHELVIWNSNNFEVTEN